MHKHIPRANGAKRRSGRKPGARVTNSGSRVTNSARLFTPGETKALAESKVNQISRAWVTNDGWSSSLISNRQEWKGQRFKKIYVRKITQHEDKFFQLSLKE